MVSTTVIGAIVGVFIGVVLLIVLITCIIYISRRLKKKTNSRSKIISSDGLVIKDNWMYFGHIDRTEHVEVKEKRRREEIVIPPEPEPQPPPPPPPAPVVVPPPSPPRPPPRFARYRIRSWPKRQREPLPVRRRASIGHAEGVKHFVYGIPYPVPSWMPAPNQSNPSPPPPPQPVPSAPPAPNPAVESVTPAHKCHSIEEQERVLVIDDTMTEKSYNPRYNTTVSATVSDHILDTVTETNNGRQCNRTVPKIITDLV